MQRAGKLTEAPIAKNLIQYDFIRPHMVWEGQTRAETHFYTTSIPCI